MTDQEFIRNFKLSEETIQILEQHLDASIEELRKLPLYACKTKTPRSAIREMARQFIRNEKILSR